MNRRNFIRSLALGIALLTTRLRPESKLPEPELMGFTGESTLEEGYVYCPYIPLHVTRIGDIKPSDLRVHKPRVTLHPAELIRMKWYGGYEKYYVLNK